MTWNHNAPICIDNVKDTNYLVRFTCEHLHAIHPVAGITLRFKAMRLLSMEEDKIVSGEESFVRIEWQCKKIRDTAATARYSGVSTRFKFSIERAANLDRYGGQCTAVFFRRHRGI